MRGTADATYYAQLEAGADYLAREAADPGERDTHRRMAGVYRERAREAAAPVDAGMGIES